MTTAADHDAARTIDQLASLPPLVPPPLSSALEAELGKLAAVKPRRPLRQLAILVAISVVYGGGILALIHIRNDIKELPMGWLVCVGLGWLFGFVIPCHLALVPGAGSMAPRWRLAAIVSVLASIGFVVLGLAMHPSDPTLSQFYYWQRFGHGHSCLEIGLATALVPVVLGALFLRGVMPVGSRWVAAALGAGGGCLGGLVLHLHCNIADAQHVGLIHGGVVGVSALLAAAIVPRATDM